MAVSRALLAALALVLSGPLVAQHGEQHMHRRFDDAEKWSKVFDDPGLRFVFSTRSPVPDILRADGSLFYGEGYKFVG